MDAISSSYSANGKSCVAILTLSIALVLTGCQGLTNSSSGGGSPVTGVSISPPAATVVGATSQQFTATVQGTPTTVNWSVDGMGGGSATVGTISATGLYTAPSQVGPHNITATSTANTSFSATSAVSVFIFTVSPNSMTLAPSATQQFTASIQGLSNTSVTWSVDGVAGGNATSGTISAGGLYTAPATTGPHTVSATATGAPTVSVSVVATVINTHQTAVLTYHNDNARDGAYLDEINLTPSNVNSTKFGKLATFSVDGQVYAQPLYLPQVSIAGGTHDVVFVETQNNSAYAFDADATTQSAPSAPFWHFNFGGSVPKGDIEGVNPNVGILSTPVIDSTTNTIYLVVETTKTTNASPFYLYALDASTGAEKIPHISIQATDSGSGDTLDPSCYQRMGLALSPVTNWIYVPFGSCNHGWVLAYDKSSLAQTAVFNDTSGAAGGGLWASGGAPAIDDTNGNVYIMTGVDTGDQQYITGSTQIGYNDSFLNLNPTTLTVQSYFSPDNNQTLAINDADLGSGSPVLLPGNLQHPKELVGGGKDGNVYVNDPDNMGGFNDMSNNVLQTIHIGTQQYNNIFATPVYWNGFIYYHTDADVMRAFSWSAGGTTGSQLSANSTSAGTVTYNGHGATASLSANGAINGIVWDTDNSAYNQSNPNASGPLVLHAYDATNLKELYNSTQAGTRDTAGIALKFTVPTIANGRVFVPTGNQLNIYGLLP